MGALVLDYHYSLTVMLPIHTTALAEVSQETVFKFKVEDIFLITIIFDITSDCRELQMQRGSLFVIYLLASLAVGE